MVALESALDQIIAEQRIAIVFQPIVSLTNGEVLGYEALSRITGTSPIKNIEELFVLAHQHDRLWDLELICRTKALVAASKFTSHQKSQKLFLNVNPNIIRDRQFEYGLTKSLLQKYEIKPDNVIFEITERHVVEDMEGFRATIDHYKKQSYLIAVDDSGAGYSGLNLISEVNPNYIKLDMSLIRDINTNRTKNAIVKGMVEFARVTNTRLIAEGIETADELKALVDLGVHYGQGYFLQKPDCLGVCVVEDQAPLGIVTHDKLIVGMGGRYGFHLYYNRPIAKLMDQEFLVVDVNTPVVDVASLAMARPLNRLYDFIVVTDADKYYGVVTIKDLLQKTIEVESNTAKHLNPLTGLPGNVLIDQKIEQCVNNSQDYSVAYVDIDNFKAYNDNYGFENGDLVIRFLADLLVHEFGEQAFVGHIGGDDFALVFENQIILDEKFKIIKERYANEVLRFYNQQHLEQGFITATNRQGLIEKYSLTQITCVSVNSERHHFNSSKALTETLAKLKANAKIAVRNGENLCHV